MTLPHLTRGQAAPAVSASPFARTLASALALTLAFTVATAPRTHADPVISEFVADNETGLRDEDNTIQDWIEIHNPSVTPFSLDGWYLTDNAANLTKWKFPAVTLAPGDFLVVFASSKDRRIPGTTLHTNFSLRQEGEYLALVRPDGLTVQQQYAPEYPNQDADRSFGLLFNRTTLLADGINADYLVPSSAAALAANWNTAAATPAGWTLAKPLGVGFGFNVPGLTITVRAKNTATGLLNAQSDAELLLSRPSGHSEIASEQISVQPTFNVLGSGGEGHYGANNPLPVWAQEDYVVRATGTIVIPTAGVYTFGINSDDGGKIVIDGNTVMNDPTLHGPADFLGSVTLTAGNHTIDAYFWERGGGDEGELYARAGSASAWDANFRLVGDTAAGGLAAFTSPVGSVSSAAVRTNVETAMRNVNASCFVRVPFTGTGAGSFTSLSLLMRYNDGFKAWLNGTALTASNAPASPAWNSTATASRLTDASLSAAGFNITSALPGIINGTNLLAIQGLNITSADSNFLVLPEIVAGSLPAVQESAFYNKPTPGAINSTPDSLGKVADTVFFPTRGFFPNATTAVVPFPVTITTSTPGASIRYTTDGSTPTETVGTLYTGPIFIGTTTVLRAIAYKTNWQSTNVDTHSYLIPNDIILQSPTGAAPPGAGWAAPGNGVNGQLIDYGMDPDIVNSGNTAIGGQAQVKAALLAIPSVSIATDNPNLWNASTGIYMNPGGRGLAWERRASMELLNDPAGGFASPCGIRIRGGFSRSGGNPKHAFHIYFRGDYGAGKLDYPLYGDAATTTYNQFDLRTAQNYSWSFGGDGQNSFLREEFTRQTHVDMGRPDSHVKYVHLYLNGVYWGLYEFDERTEADHCSTYMGGNKEDWDVVKCEQDSGYTTGVTDGFEDKWQLLGQKANPLTSPGVYNRRALTATDYYDMQGLGPDGITPNGSPVLLDPDALIDYMLLTFWSGNLDGCTSAFLGNQTANNWFGARDRTKNRGFVYFAHDFEHSLFNTGEDRTGPYNRTFSDLGSYNTKINDNYNPMFLHADLLDVAEYKLRWHNRVQKHLFNGGQLSLAANTARINKLAAIVDTSIIAESARWGDAISATPLNKTNWLGQRDTLLNNYLPNRTASVISQLRADGLYPALDGITFTPPGGYILSTAPLNLTGPSGRVWYFTTDGSDPRLPNGSISASARVFTPSGVVTDTLISDGATAPGATWKYRDPSIDLGSSDIVVGHPSYNNTNWKHPQFDDSSPTIWRSGDAELGAGDTNEGRPERTVINIGPTNPRFEVLYFRKKFTVANPAQYDALELEALIDDGAIFYINGREVARLNMPSGAIGFAYGGINAINEAAFLPVTDARLLPSVLVAGENTICVQVHQSTAASTDLSFDMRLRGRKTVFNTPVLLPAGVQTVKARAYDTAGSSWSALSEVTYVVDAEPASASNLVVSGIQYHPAVTAADLPAGYNDDTFFEYLELMNIGPKTVDLTGIRFTDGLTWTFDSAATAPRLLAPGARLVVVGHRAAFISRHGGTPVIAGQFSGQLDNGGELITLRAADNSILRSFTYDDAAPWPVAPDGAGPSLVLIHPEANPDHNVAANWRASYGTGSPGGSDAFTYTAWKSIHAPGQADTEDADTDGLTTFWEYVSAGTPGLADTSKLPVAGLEPVTVAGNTATYQTLTAVIRTGADDIQLFPESGSNITDWTAADMTLLRRVDNGNGTESWTWRHARPWKADQRVFLRLRAILAP